MKQKRKNALPPPPFQGKKIIMVSKKGSAYLLIITKPQKEIKIARITSKQIKRDHKKQSKRPCC